jgi:hypothetical protein
MVFFGRTIRTNLLGDHYKAPQRLNPMFFFAHFETRVSRTDKKLDTVVEWSKEIQSFWNFAIEICQVSVLQLMRQPVQFHQTVWQ